MKAEWAKRCGVGALALTMSLGSAQATFAQGLIFRPPTPEPPPQTSAPTAPVQPEVVAVPEVPSCVIADVKMAPTLPSGDEWDFDPSPEFLIRETVTGTSFPCEGKFACSFRIEGVQSARLSFLIVEQDTFNEDDVAGQGACSIGETCAFSSSTVSLSAC